MKLILVSLGLLIGILGAVSTFTSLDFVWSILLAIVAAGMISGAILLDMEDMESAVSAGVK